MFQLRDQHLEAFSKAALDRFETGVIKHLRTVFPDYVVKVSDGAIRIRVQECTPRAAVYGLTSQYEILCFVDATYVLGDRFDNDPKHAELKSNLENTVMPGQSRADWMMDYICERVAPGQ